MPHVVDTEKLVRDGLIGRELANEIARRSRETMVALTVNTLLCAGILAATFGLVFWLADALLVAVTGAVFLGAGAAILLGGSDLYRMLGNALAVVGAGMLVAGMGFELVKSFRDIADFAMLAGGAVIGAAGYWLFAKGDDKLHFASGSVFLMGVALHLWGVGLFFEHATDWTRAVVNGYSALVVAAAGTAVNVRLVTALAIVPFAEMLNTGTDYFHALYVFYSPEPTLSILQMAALIGACLWAAGRLEDRYGRHAGILAIMAAVVGNLSFLVGSLWGDNVLMSMTDGGPIWTENMTYEQWNSASDAWEAQFFYISEHVFTVVWAVLLTGAAFWAAHANRRGLFNAAVTFGGIHAYTQLFETMADEPLAWALGGLAAIPLAWGMWRLNRWLVEREKAGLPA